MKSTEIKTLFKLMEKADKHTLVALFISVARSLLKIYNMDEDEITDLLDKTIEP